jgi:predicted nuclease with TOPRIM domain
LTSGEPGATPPASTPPAERRAEKKNRVTCSICDCEIYASSGELIDKLSPKAKRLRDSQNEIDSLTESRDAARADVTERDATIKQLRERITELESKVSAAPTAEKSGGYKIPIKL